MKLRVKIEDQIYEVEVGDLNARPVLASVDGDTFEVWPEEAQAAPLARRATPTATAPAAAPISAPRVSAVPASGGKGVHAPIPGTIVAIAVQVGDTVKPGQELCTLEAMKMKNAIRTTRDGVIAKILVQTGERVGQGHLLVEFAE